MTTAALTLSTLETPSIQFPCFRTSFTSCEYSLSKPAAVWEDATVSDETLMAALAQGAEWAMEQLYQRYVRYVYALAYHILHDSGIAEDIVQDVFLSVWRKAQLYQEQQGSVRSWLQAIVHHRAIDKVRASAHREYQWTPLQIENEQDPPSEAPEVWEEAWEKEQATILRNALARLPQAQRRVIELSYFAGYTHVEIAERENLPLGTVKGRIRLALQKLRHLVQDTLQDV